MAEKSPLSEHSIDIDAKEHDNDEEFIDSLLELPVIVTDGQPIKSIPTTTIERFLGIIYTLSGAFIFTVSVFITKQLHVDLFNALIPRFLLQTILLFIYMKFIKHYSLYTQATKKELFLLFINVFFFTTGFATFFIAYHYLPLADVTTIRYTKIIWTAIITAIIYCEKPSIATILGVILTTVGVIFVAQPKFLFEKSSSTIKNQSENDYHDHLIGLALAFYVSIAFAIGVITNKYLLSKYKTKHSLIMLQFTFTSLCIGLIYLFIKYYRSTDIIQSIKNDFLNGRYLCASSICLLQIVQSMLTQKAIKREHPSVFAIVQASDILFAILLQNIFSSMKSNLLSIFGSILVLISIIIISCYKFIGEKKKIVYT